jgi:arylamine N-acetyltransferase
MDRFLLLDTRGGYHYTGGSLIDVVLSTRDVTFDYAARRVVVYGKPDTVGFTTDYSHEEMAVEMARRAITVLKRYGWQLFRNDDI